MPGELDVQGRPLAFNLGACEGVRYVTYAVSAYQLLLVAVIELDLPITGDEPRALSAKVPALLRAAQDADIPSHRALAITWLGNDARWEWPDRRAGDGAAR